MSKDVRRVHPRVSYEKKIRLLGNDGKPVIVGRTLNLSPSGIYVRAPQGCAIGSEVTCDLPLPGGTRQIHGRVTRTQPLPDASTGIGIQFVDLTTGDSSSLHRALEGTGSRPVTVKVMFEGMGKPIKCQGSITAEGIRLSTSLPFLRLGSDVQAEFDGQSGRTDARGVLTGIRLEPVAGDGVPRLGVEVDLEPEAISVPSAPGATWDGEGDEPETTAVVARRDTLSVAFKRAESLHAWGFVAVATFAFCVVYVAMYRFAPHDAESRAHLRPRPALAGPTVVRSGPVIVPAEGVGGPSPRAAIAAEAPHVERSTEPPRTPRTVRTREPSAKGDAAVQAGALYLAIPLAEPQPDARFAVQVTPSWTTTLAIVGKTADGFTVSFGTPAPEGARIDWVLVR